MHTTRFLKWSIAALVAVTPWLVSRDARAVEDSEPLAEDEVVAPADEKPKTKKATKVSAKPKASKKSAKHPAPKQTAEKKTTEKKTSKKGTKVAAKKPKARDKKLGDRDRDGQVAAAKGKDKKTVSLSKKARKNARSKK